MRYLLVFSFLAFCFVGNGQIINFPDANFKNALVNTICTDSNGDGSFDSDADLNDDGEIDVSEALKVIGLNVSSRQISSLASIEYFKNLKKINCSYNELKYLDVSELTSLITLNCTYNPLEYLNVDGLINLTTLNCEKNQLTNLNVEGLNNLNILTCFDNKLTNLNIYGLDNLVTLLCYTNQLTSLDAQGLTSLVNLDCNYNQLIYINIQGLTNLKILSCNNNQLTNLNVDELTNLTELHCRLNQLTSLRVEGLTKLNKFDCSSNRLTSLDLQGLISLTDLSCGINKLTNLTVQGLTNLKYLICFHNQLKTFDVQGLTNLIELTCSNNKLTSLNVNGLINLKVLICSKNELKSIDLQGLTNLIELSCSYNELTSLHGESMRNLTELYCNNNQLTTIEIKGMENLKYFNCIQNQLTSISFVGFTNLINFFCSNNQLTSLDLQELSNITSLYCDNNQLEQLNIKGTNISQTLFFQNNSNLEYICCNDELINDIKNKSISNGQNCEVNSYCSFTPNGKFYILKGENKYDANNNGCDDQDIKMANFKYNITDGISSGSIITNSTGNYSIPVQAGTHTITPILEHPSHFEVTPSSFTVTFPSTSDTITQDFCITPKGIFRQTNITVIPLIPPARPGFEAQYKIVWENVGNQIESGTLNFTYDETLLDYISATQIEDLKSDGILSWYFNNLLPFEKREITVTLKVNRPTDTPAVSAGDKLYLTASILDNIFTLENTVVGSYDPNDKTCLQGDRVKPDMVGEYVDYLIRFENTGNYAAENVVVKDIIDTKTFDVSTLKITDASHEVYTRIEGNKVEFIFENIQLPFDDAHNDGYIAFKIKTLPSLVFGDSLKNLADIYFDYNFPIRTNEAQTTVAFPVFTKDITTEVNIYPNPVTDILYLDTNETWSKADIYDIAGRIMRSASLNGHSLDVRELESGTYFIRLKDGVKVGLVKFVKI